jgi:hypothetical protein
LLARGGDIDIDLKYDYRAIGQEHEAEVLKKAHINNV